MLNKKEELFWRLKMNGVQTEHALHVFLDDPVYYMDVLGEFLHLSDVDEMKTCLEKGDINGAERCALDIKGLTGTLGISTAYDASLLVCSCIREHKIDEARMLSKVIENSLNFIREIYDSKDSCREKMPEKHGKDCYGAVQPLG